MNLINKKLPLKPKFEPKQVDWNYITFNEGVYRYDCYQYLIVIKDTTREDIKINCFSILWYDSKNGKLEKANDRTWEKDKFLTTNLGIALELGELDG